MSSVASYHYITEPSQKVKKNNKTCCDFERLVTMWGKSRFSFYLQENHYYHSMSMILLEIFHYSVKRLDLWSPRDWRIYAHFSITL